MVLKPAQTLFRVRASLAFQKNLPLLMGYNMKSHEKTFRFHLNLFLSQEPRITSLESKNIFWLGSITHH